MTAADDRSHPPTARPAQAGSREGGPDRERPIWQLGAAELARRIAEGEISSTEVVEACIGRMEEVDGRLNALVARRWDEARREAREADQRRQRGQLDGPLHGVPVTIKECFFIAGIPATLGLSARARIPSTRDGPPVARLREAGAIVLAATNVSQAMLLHESDNPLYGRTNNPWNLERTCGGSSGGEAAIIAAGGSPLGLGSDLGGSIRVPCHFCGIAGLKPTDRRLGKQGTAMSLRGLEAIEFQPGPMARHVADLELALRVLADPGQLGETEEPPFAPLEDFKEIDLSRLRIGYWSDDGYFASSPAVARAVEEAAGSLADRGTVVEPFAPPDLPEGLATYFGLVSADGGADLKRLLRGSRVDARLRRLERLGGYPRWLRVPLAGLLRMSGQHYLAELLSWCGPRSADGFWQLTLRRDEYRQRFRQALLAAGIDVLICPPHALPALKHGRGVDLLQAASSTLLPNLLGYPAGTVPITRVRPGEDTGREAGRDSVQRIAHSTELGSAGLPVGVQVVAGPWQEARILAVMAHLERHFRQQDDYPSLPPL